MNEELKFLYKKKFWEGGWGVGGSGCECERRFEVFVIMQRKNLGGGVGWRSWWM